MTVPNLDFLNSPQTPDLSFLDTPQQEPGAFQYLGNLAHNFGLTVAAQGYNSNDPVIQPLANFMFRNNPQERQQITEIRGQLEQANLKGSDAWKKVMEDFTPTNFFSKLGDSIGNLVDGNVSVGDIVTGLPKSILSTVGSPLEAATGLSLGNESAIALPPEERAAKIKETAGILVASGVGAVARSAMTAGLGKLAVAGTEGASADVAANMIQQGGKLGLLGKQIIRNTVVGGTEAGLAGAAFGATSGANTEHQAGQIFSGLLFAPLGVVGEMIGSKVRGGDKITEIQRKAGDLFAMRQLGYSPDKSLFELMKNTESIATSDDLAMAVAKGKLETGDGHIIVPGVSESRMLDAKAEEVGGGYYRTFSYKRPDGLHDVLFANDARNEPGPHDTQYIGFRVFEQTGYLPNEVVSYKGKDYLFDGKISHADNLEATSKMSMEDIYSKSRDNVMTLRDPVSGKKVHVYSDEITRNSTFNLETGEVTINSPLTLKGKLIAMNRNITANPYGGYNGDIINPYQKENDAALQSVTTGKPIAFVGMRQSRGQQIIGNGKFYALSPEHLLAYTPTKYEGYSPEIIKGGASPFKLGTITGAPGRQTIPGILDANLSVNRLTFEKPFVFDGKHYSFSRDVENFYNKYVKSPSAPSWAVKDLAKSGALSDAGVTWGSIFTEKEMAGIVEARKLERKPIGLPTPTYLKGLKSNSPLDIGEENSPVTEQDYYSGNYEPYHAPGKTHSESHYAVIDRIVAGAMKRNGYDGFIYRSGGIHNSEIVDIKERGVWNRADQTVPVSGKASNILDATKFVDKLYDEFKTTNWQVDENGKFSDESLFTGKPFEQSFNNFASKKGFLPEEIPNLRRSFEQRIHGEILDNLPEGEKQLFSRLKNEITTTEEIRFNNGSDNLRRSALQNNMYFDQADAGVIHLRDVNSNKSLGTFHSVEDAQNFIKNSGQELGVNLDGNANIPPSGSGAVLPDNLGPMQTPPVGWLERKYALWTTRLPWLTANPTLFKNWDSLFQSNLHENVFNIVDKAARLKEGKKSPWLSKLQTIDNVLGKATLADREHVFNWMETRSIAEHLSQGGVGGKPLSAMEVALGKQLVPADLGNVFRYKNAMRSVDAGDVNTISALKQQFNIGLDEEAALNLLQVAERQPLEKLSIGSSVHYARLLQNPELALTRSEYAKKFNLSQKQLQVGAGLDKYFADLADVAGIPKDKLLFNYITHARLYENGNLDAAINKFALTKPVQEFYAALNRTGEIQSYEKDPIRAALRYTNAMFDVLYTNPAILKAQENLKVELGKLPAGAQAKVMRDANKYLEDVMHRPAIGDKYADAAVNHLNNTVLGKGLSDYHSRKWINAVNEVFTMAAQGMRPWAGIRDFYSNTSKYFIKWGLSDTLDMLRFGADANLDNLRQSGLIEGYSNFGLNSAVDDAADALSQAGSHLKKFVDKSAQLGMKVSGQQYVNDMARAGAFLNTRNKVAELSRNLVEKKFGDDLTKPETFQKAYHSIQLERYAPPVQAAFDKLIKQNKFDEAANYLGNQHIQETFGSYANANHPSGWNNNFGRLVGKFGQWSINHRDYLVSLASRGTRSQRLQALGRLAITESSIAAVAGTLGVNLSNFYSIPGMYFKGGPAGDLFYTAYSAMFGRGAEQEAALQKVKRLLPYDGEQFRPSIIVPFSYAFGDLVDGLGMAADGDVMGGMARIGGIRPQSDTYKPSGFEETIGDTVNGR